MSTIIGLVSTFRLPLQGAADWTLERREGIRKSKREAKVWWIGRWSGEKAVESPKEKPRRGGLDVKVERGQ